MSEMGYLTIKKIFDLLHTHPFITYVFITAGAEIFGKCYVCTK